jgi:hypothetical protein
MEQSYNQVYLDISEYTTIFSNETSKPKPKLCLESIGNIIFGLDISINENTQEAEALIMPVGFLSEYKFRFIAESIYFSLIYKGYIKGGDSKVNIYNLFNLSQFDISEGENYQIDFITIDNIDQFDKEEDPGFCDVDKINCFCLEGFYEEKHSLEGE